MRQVLPLCLLLAMTLSAPAAPADVLSVKAPKQTTWTFENIDRVGGVKTTAEGQPSLIDTPVGKAVAFDGVKDALFFDAHPLAGAETFTFEAIFRPDGGAFEQRWFHLAEIDPATGKDSTARMLFEIRVVGNEWYLDAFVTGPGYKTTLIAPEKKFPVGHWYRVEQTFDGKTYRSYVDGVLQAEAETSFKAQGAGHASLGVRINRLNYFHGAVLKARFTDRALPPEHFLPLPDGLK